MAQFNKEQRDKIVRSVQAYKKAILTQEAAQKVLNEKRADLGMALGGEQIADSAKLLNAAMTVLGERYLEVGEPDAD